MAEDPAEQVTLKLTFWHKDKKPGDTVQVRRDEVPMWRGFAVPADDTPQDKPAETVDQAPEPVKAGEAKADEQPAGSTPAKASSSRAK
jgi:hypothetical protein